MAKRRSSVMSLSATLFIFLGLVLFIIFAQKKFHFLTQAVVTRPNVLIILTDDQRADTMSYMPQVSSMGGTTFTNAFAPTSICCPARAAFLTGKYAHNSGVWSNQGSIEAFSDDASETLAVWLDREGYRTAWYGKYLNGWGTKLPKPPGWDVFNPKAAWFWGKKYHVDAIATQVINFMNAGADPFFVVASIRVPHANGTNDNGAPGNPPPVPTGTVCPTYPVWRPPSYGLTGSKVQEMDAFRAGQLCALEAVDGKIRNLINNAPSNTVIIFMGDQGHMWGEHGEVSKGRHWDESTRLPLLIRVPNTPVGTSSALMGMVDVAPTILDAVGVAIPDTVDGISQMPVIRGEQTSIRDNILIEHIGSRGLRTADLLYIAEPAEAIYADQWQLNNVVNDPAYADQLTIQRDAFATLRDCAGLACRE